MYIEEKCDECNGTGTRSLWNTCQSCHRKAEVIKLSELKSQQLNSLTSAQSKSSKSKTFTSDNPTAWSLRPSEKQKIDKMHKALTQDDNLLGSPEFENDILVKVRSTGKLLDAKIDIKNKNNAEVILKIPEDGISPGQACVFYKKDELGYKVLGGGWI